MVFRGKVGKGDYHNNMDGDMFMKWINERLVPTVQQKYPGKQVLTLPHPFPHSPSPPLTLMIYNLTHTHSHTPTTRFTW